MRREKWGGVSQTFGGLGACSARTLRLLCCQRRSARAVNVPEGHQTAHCTS